MTNLRRLFRSSTLLLSLASSLVATSLIGRAQNSPNLEATEKISRAFTLSTAAGPPALAVYNLNGSVTVQGYAGSQVLVEATKTIRADNAADLAAGQREAQLNFEQHGDSVAVYLVAPYDARPGDHHRNETRMRLPYHFVFDVVVKVPYASRLHAATINQGTVRVLDVTGPLDVSNVNGAVAMTNVRGTTQARTINGSLDATYAVSPPGASSYRTINGPIRVQYPAGFGATAHFKSMHGELFTDFAQAQLLPPQVVKNQTGQGSGTAYHLTKETAVRIGSGGPDLRFETLNGNVTISKR